MGASEKAEVGHLLRECSDRTRSDVSNYRPVSLPLGSGAPGEALEQIMHIQDTPGISPSEQGCTKGRSCLAKLVSFHGKMRY